jgi:hypothetical protein
MSYSYCISKHSMLLLPNGHTGNPDFASHLSLFSSRIPGVLSGETEMRLTPYFGINQSTSNATD